MAFGRPRVFDTPEQMMELFLAYKAETKKNPILVQDFVGKDGDEVHRQREKPLTMSGFEVYCFEHGFGHDLDQYFSNRNNRYADFVAVCSHIKAQIRTDQIQGGMAGIYNPSITQRLNGLVEKTATEHSGGVEVNYDLAKVSPEALKELLNAATNAQPNQG